jgi:beta-glucuronidase
VPASYNDIFADAEVHNYLGDVWYQTLVRVPARWAG